MDAAQIVRRVAFRRGQRSNIEAKWDEIERLVMPLDQDTFAKTVVNEGEKQWDSLDVWDSTAPIGAERLSSMFYSGLFSGRWVGYGFTDQNAQMQPTAKGWLQRAATRVFNSIMSSNFLVEASSTIRSWVGYGNGAITRQPIYKNGKWAGMDFLAPALRNVFFDETTGGVILNFYQPFQWTPQQMVEKFRDPDDPTKPHKSLPERVVNAAEKDEQEKEEVIFCIFRRLDKKPMGLTEKSRGKLERPYGVKYVLAKERIEIGDEDGMYAMDAYVTRYSRTATSQWGYGPSLVVLPTVKLLNAFMETVLNAAAKVVDPATLVTERGLLSNLELGPGERTVVRTLEDIAPYESKARFDVSESMLLDMRNMIRKVFREDDITLKESPQMSATEATIRDDRLNRLFGPQVRQIQGDMLAPIVQNTFEEMYREGQIEPLPDEVAQYASSIQIQFYGQFMRAQRTDEVAAIERLLASVAAGIKMQLPRSKYRVKIDQAYKEMAELLGTPASLIATDQEVEAAEKNDRQIAEQMAKAEIAKTSAEANRAQAGAAAEAPDGSQSMMQGGMAGA